MCLLSSENYLSKLKKIAELKRNGQIDYDEMGDMLLGDKNIYSSDNIRKFWYIFDKIIDNIDDTVEITEEDLVNELELKRKEIIKERYKLQATKIEQTRYDRQDARRELFYENIRNAIKSLPLPDFKELPFDYENDKEYVVGMGDFHFGANFRSQNNTYSREECKRRLEKLSYALKCEIFNNDIYKLKIINVADTIQGILRLTDLQLNEVPVVESVVEISRLIAEFLNDLSAFCEIEYYHCSSANHSQTRPLGSKASELAAEDLEKVIVSYISDMLRDNNRIKVISDLAKDYLTFNIFNFKAIILHGHQIKNPNETIKDLSNLHREFYDFCFLGHRHSANEVIVGEGKTHNIEILTCPSFIGSDPYSDSLMVGSKAMVKLYEFDKIYGHTASKNIILN